MPYPEAFLNIQLVFARRIAEITDKLYAESVLRNTALYRILGLDWSLDTTDPAWQKFIAALSKGSGAAYGVYRERHAQGLVPDYDDSRPHWGCFSFEYQPDERTVRLHFSNQDTSGLGPLGSSRRDTRLAELRAMFTQVQREFPEAELVHGGSWLYNRVEYTRLYPREFGDSAHAVPPPFIGRGLWGQFLRHGNHMNEETTAAFLANVTALGDADHAAACFPYQLLVTQAPIRLFYAFYGLGDPH